MRAVLTSAARSATATSRRSASTARHDDLGVGGVWWCVVEKGFVLVCKLIGICFHDVWDLLGWINFNLWK